MAQDLDAILESFDALTLGEDQGLLTHITSLAQSETQTKKLLQHFRDEPYDPDYQAEEYYEHEERLGIDKAYVKRFQRVCEQISEIKREREWMWIDFWIRTLSNCPHGPTLFNPRESLRVKVPHLTNVPRYLFRAFDESSSGHSDDHVVASQQSISYRERSKVDLLSRSPVEAANMLYAHLDKSCFGAASSDDNLMSWSSSLLHVVQYAIWRTGQHAKKTSSWDPGNVSICAVDTTKFPKGQFARDMDLIRLHREAAEGDHRMRQFFDFRLNRLEYDNGEFLSQGELTHTDRSCVFNLDELLNGGLHDLYPELSEDTEKWTNRVLTLHSQWSSTNHLTFKEEMYTALRLARTCFKAFDATDVALLLLSFKNRENMDNTLTGSSSSTLFQEERQKYLAHWGPKEVQRYMEIAEKIQRRLDAIVASNPLFSRVGVPPILEEVFTLGR